MQRLVDFARKVWAEEEGFIVSAELIFIVTILVIGLVAGWGKIKAAVNEELNDVALAIGELSQAYYFGEAIGTTTAGVGTVLSESAGTTFDDLTDLNAGDSVDSTANTTDGMTIGFTTNVLDDQGEVTP